MTGRKIFHAWRDDSGALAMVSALLLMAVFGFSALVIDVGSLYLTRRSLQTATDAAALAATYGLNTAPLATTTVFAGNYLGYNGFAAAKLTGTPVVTTGRYCPNPATSPPTPSSRFTATTSSNSVCATDPTGTQFGSGPNAVQVTASTTAPLYFARVLLPGSVSQLVTTTATATQSAAAGFSIGTGLASVSTSSVNGVLSGLLGTSVSLSALSYQGLVSTDINALSFLNALATQLNVSGGTYGSLLSSSVSLGAVLNAAATVLGQSNGVVNTGGSSANALAGLNTLIAALPAGQTVQLSQLLDVGTLQNQGIGASSSPLTAGINLYDLVTLTAQVINGGSAVAVPSAALSIPGLATVSSTTTVIQPAQSPPFAFGPVGVTVTTSQVRLQMSLSLLSGLSVLGTSAPVTLPLVINIGNGTATLTAITCGLHPATDATVQISAQSSAAQAYIGTVSPATPLANFSNPTLTVQPATLVTLNVLGTGLVAVNGRAEADVGASSPTTLTFNQTEIANATPQTVTSTNATSTLLKSLGSSLALTATVLGVPILPALTATISAALTTLLAPVFAQLDPLVDGVLAALGIQLGYMNVTATGVRCGVPSLVL